VRFSTTTNSNRGSTLGPKEAHNNDWSILNERTGLIWQRQKELLREVENSKETVGRSHEDVISEEMALVQTSVVRRWRGKVYPQERRQYLNAIS